MPTPPLRQQIQSMSHTDEHRYVAEVLRSGSLDQITREKIVERARKLTIQCRQDGKSASPLDAFLLEFGLSNKEGVALMCLAEALLRVPDALTCNRLIAEKIKSGNWKDHNGQSNSLFVNASTWGLMLTGKIVRLDESITDNPGNWLGKLVSRSGEPVVRTAMLESMRIMGNQYVLGRTIKEAIKRGRKLNQPSTRFSFDMLGEGARTYQAAEAYFNAYSDAINAIGEHRSSGDSVDDANNTAYGANGISVKLSALHPRYHFSHQEMVMSELFPKIKQLCLQAKQYNMGLSIDAEEVDRLDLSLDIFEKLARDEQLQNWQGLGFVLQAYQKRAASVADWLIDLAKQTNRRLMVRLVKGAYWDAEIKHAQEQGFVDYPVFTRKENTDLNYQYCCQKLLDAQPYIYPQFATHNAYTVAMVMELAGEREFEFQRLHGMGDLLYKHFCDNHAGKDVPVRVYAPVGNHKDLLPYLVRRLLENGANSSFVNRFLDQQTPVDQLIQDVEQQVLETTPHRHQNICVPTDIYHEEGRGRKNAKGLDINSPIDTAELLRVIEKTQQQQLCSYPIIDGDVKHTEQIPINNPANGRAIGSTSQPTTEHVSAAMNVAADYFPTWNELGGAARARILDDVANALETHFNEFIAYICLEAGRTLADGISEVREAIDFCRYYANKAREYCAAPYKRQGQGVFLCISPWNFPLAIFTGQIAAALAGGNTVIAKPAPQTTAVAYQAIKLFHDAGVPTQALQFLPGNGPQIGSQLIKDLRLAGICFTGSTRTAQLINKQLAQRPGPAATLIAETGGQNAMIVDSTALPEQVVDDIISSAFQSAGQRCSALRVLFLQEEIADTVISMLQGAMQALNLGDPSLLSTDVGPVIDPAAKKMLEDHIHSMQKTAKPIAAVNMPENLEDGYFFAPRAIEISSLSQLPNEVFGPILHVIRYKAKQLPDVLQQINNTGFGLTLGIHSRIEMIADYIYKNTNVGNTYINRNMVGAVVGVNPFGGQGLSGTGPKAGGPNYLMRFTQSQSTTPDNAASTVEIPSAVDLAPTPDAVEDALKQAHANQILWAKQSASERAKILNTAATLLTLRQTEYPFFTACAQYCDTVSKLILRFVCEPIKLPGPTGEDNTLSLHGRGVALCLASNNIQQCFIELIISIASGCSAVLLSSFIDSNPELKELLSILKQAGLPDDTVQCINTTGLNRALLDPLVDAVIVESTSNEQGYQVRNLLAQREGALLPLIDVPEQFDSNNVLDLYALLTRLMHEKTKTDNIVAKGGNTTLFNLS